MSIRVASSSLIAGSVVVGDPGHGVLGSLIPATGEHGAGYAYSSLELPTDASKEIRGLITTWPTLGTLFAFEDTSFTYDGPSDTFAWQMYVDGVAVGSPQTVTITVGEVEEESVEGSVASLSIVASSGAHAVFSTGSGGVQALSLMPPAGDATTASTTFASGDLIALSIAAPNGTSAVQTAVSAGIQHLSLTAPAGDASSASTTFAAGEVAPVSLAAPAGTTAQSTASSGAIQLISLTAPNGNASTGADMVASGDIAPIGIFTASGASVVAASAFGAIRHLTISALMGAANDGSAPAFDLRGSVFARVPAHYDVFARLQ